MRRSKIIAGMICALWLSHGSIAALAEEEAEANSSKLPRFVSLKADEANMRTGPGVRYPIRWVYQQRGLPVKITEEFEHWRKIEDPDGETGWIHRSILSNRRMAMIDIDEVLLRRTPSEESAAILRAQHGVLARMIECQPRWCRIQIDSIKGWVPKKTLWGVQDQEVFE